MPRAKRKSADTLAREKVEKRRNETCDDVENRQAYQRNYASTSRQQESQSQQFERLSGTQSSNQIRRSLESPDDRALRLSQMREYAGNIREHETPAVCEQRLRAMREHAYGIREQEAPEARQQRLQAMREHASDVREQEAPEVREARLEALRDHDCIVREHESAVDREQRVRAMRHHASDVRNNETLEHRAQRSENNETGLQNDRDYTCFEKMQKSMIWEQCGQCNESFPNLKINGGVCARCLKYTNQLNLFSVENNMDPGECPDELKDLSMIEEQLIAKVHPVLSVYRIRGQQYAFSGQVINFHQNVNSIATQLPHSIHELSSVLIVRRQGAENYSDFRVSRDKVYRALQYLKENNIYYRDIEIHQRNLSEIPEDGNLSQIYTQQVNNNNDREDNSEEADSEEVIDTNVIGIAPNDQLRMVRSALGTAGNPIQWPEISSNPINEFTTAGYVAMAFPTLFPTGAADLRAPRQKTVTHLQYFQHLMRYKDQRFAKHSRFRFFALNSHMRWTALQNSSVCVKRNSELSSLTISELKERLSRNPALIHKLICFNSNLRGTSIYLKARCNDLLEMVEFLGTPTLFFTLSAADLHWPELYRLLAPGVNFLEMDANRAMKIKNKLLNENPLIVSWFFQQRADVFINKMMGPHFFVKDFWFRTEFQHRGSPHIHGILWLEGAPDISSLDQMSDADRQNIANYFGNLVTTINTNINKFAPLLHPCQQHYSDVEDHQDDYENLINCCQRHTRHGKQCLRINKTTKVQECRFKFPFPLCDENVLIKEKDEWTFKSARNDPLINPHNRFVCEHWRANTDMQCILSTKAVLNYIAKYASKSEPKSKAYEEMYAIVLEKEAEGQAKEALRKIFLKVCAERDISAQETFHILMGWPLYHASRSFIKINVESDQWQRLDQNDDGQMTAKSVLDNYPLRPQNFAGMSLKEFYSKLYKRGTSWITRRKPAVPRVVPRRTLKADNDEVFYKQQVLVNVPWFSLDEFTNSGKSWKELYEEHINDMRLLEIPEVIEEYEQEDDDESREREEWMLVAEMGPNQQEVTRSALGLREFDLNTDWEGTYNNYTNPGSLDSFVSEQKANSGDHTVQYEMPEVTLNTEQNNIIEALRKQIQEIRQNKNVHFDEQCTIIQGKAGSGKTTVIKALCSMLCSELGPKSFLLMAPTGVAAVNVGGCTLHSALHIGIERNFQDLDGEAAVTFQQRMEECHFIIIDEMSMVGCSLFHKVDMRCRQAKPRNAHIPFGGMCLYLLGDLKQLPPVMDRPFYGTGYTSVHSDQGQLIYKSIKKCTILATAHRQQGDDQRLFREVLDRLSVGESTLDDWRFLMSREMSQVSNVSEFDQALKLLPYNEAVHSQNLCKLESLNVPVAKIPSKNNNATAAKAETDAAQGLEKVLLLAIGSRVMLKTNLWVDKGLVNGALGYVRDIVYRPGTGPPQDMPVIVCVEFDKYTGPSINGLVPIAPMTRSWKSGQTSCSRTQFPVSLAWAVTIHKSQGLTLDKVIVDIGDKELAAGCTYVALSRSKRLEDLIFNRPFDYVRLQNIKKMKALQARITEDDRLKSLARGAH